MSGIAATQYYELTDNAWLVRFEGTTRQLADRLGIRGGEAGSGLVASMASYSGRAPSELWEWLKVNWAEDA